MEAKPSEAQETLQDPEADERLDQLERQATALTREAEVAAQAAAGALREFRTALSNARAQMRERGFPVDNELEPR